MLGLFLRPLNPLALTLWWVFSLDTLLDWFILVVMSSNAAPHRNWSGYRLQNRRKRDRDPSKIDSVLRTVFSNPKFHDRLARYSFVTHWHEIVGARIAQHARPLKVVRGMLYVQVENPIWAQELVFFKETMITRLKEYVKSDIQINDIRFVVTDNLS